MMLYSCDWYTSHKVVFIRKLSCRNPAIIKKGKYLKSSQQFHFIGHIKISLQSTPNAGTEERIIFVARTLRHTLLTFTFLTTTLYMWKQKHIKATIIMECCCLMTIDWINANEKTKPECEMFFLQAFARLNWDNVIFG